MLQFCPFGAEQPEIGTCGHGPRGEVHEVFVFHVAVGEDDHIDFVLANDTFHLVFFDDRDPLGIFLACEGGGIGLVGDIGDLGGGEGDDLVLRVVAEDNVEVMEVPAGGSENQYFFHASKKASLDP